MSGRLGIGGARVRLALALAVVAAAFAIAPAGAAAAPPRIEGLRAEYLPSSFPPPQYVNFIVSTSRARFVSLTWRGHGGACASTVRTRRCFSSRLRSVGGVEFSFDNCRRTRRSECDGQAVRYRVRVTACNRSGCRSRVFGGRFEAAP